MTTSVTSQWRPGTSSAMAIRTGIDLSGASPDQRLAKVSGVTDDQLAKGFGLSSAEVRTFLTSGGRLTLPPVGTVSRTAGATEGLPMTSGGIPDFEAIRSAGGQVTGALPPLPPGSESLTFYNEMGAQRYYAAEIDLGDGRGPRYVRGATVDLAADASPALRRRAMAETAYYFARLPTDMEDARRNGGKNIFDFGAEASTISARL